MHIERFLHAYIYIYIYTCLKCIRTYMQSMKAGESERPNRSIGNFQVGQSMWARLTLGAGMYSRPESSSQWLIALPKDA